MRKTEKIPQNMQELTNNWVAEEEPTANRAKKARHAIKLICRDLGYLEPADCLLGEFPASKAGLKAIPRLESALRNDAGFRSIVSAAMNVVRFGLEKGWMTLPDAAGKDLGFPHYYIEGRTGSAWNRTQWVWDRLVAFSAGHDRRFDTLDHPFLLSFYRTLLQNRGDVLGRRDLRWFITMVRADADAGLLPDIDLPDLPNKKAPEYALSLDRWPKNFQPGIARIREWLTGEMVAGRPKRKRVRDVSAGRDLKHVELLGGYLTNVSGEDLVEHSWKTLFDSDRVVEFLRWTDRSHEENDDEGQILTGVYQESLLGTFTKLLSGPLGLPEEAKALRNLRYRFLFESNRSGPPKDLSPDSFFQCAIQLIQKAASFESRGHAITAATYRRDALLIALLGLYPRRTDTAHRITVDDHIVLRDGALPKIAIPREDTKPEVRDSILEVPEELAPLFYQYLNEDRQRLLGSQPNTGGPFFISQGGTAFCAGNARSIVRRRMGEEMGINVGPHSARHVWTPRFLLWSHGDYLSAMAVLDTSLTHIEQAYRDAQETERAAGYFQNTEKRWKQVQDERTNGNGNHSTK